MAMTKKEKADFEALKAENKELKSENKAQNGTIVELHNKNMELQNKIERSEKAIRTELEADYQERLTKVSTDWAEKYSYLEDLYNLVLKRAENQELDYKKKITALSDELKELKELKAAGSEGSGATKRSNNDLYDHADRRGRPALSDYAREQIRILRDQGRTIREIASAIGLSYGVVQKTLKENDHK